MSAFIMSKENINRVVTWLYEESVRLGLTYGAVPIVLKEFGFDVSHPIKAARFGQNMYDLNVRAVAERYGKADDMVWYEYSFEFVPSNPIPIYKSLSCWLYQCQEGRVPQEPLYRCLDEVRDYLARAIVSRLRDYEQAEEAWG